jgi:hypothetical protein
MAWCSGWWRKAIAAAIVLSAGCMTLSLWSTAGAPDPGSLVIVKEGRSDAAILLSPKAGARERQAALDLAKYIKLMSGAELPVVSAPGEMSAALAGSRPVLVLGQAALDAKPALAAKLSAVLKKKPSLRADGIVLLRDGNKVYAAGGNDESHYFAVAELLRGWGVRWFMPGDFGESVPHETTLSVGRLDIAYAPPFEVRTFWVSWLGEKKGVEPFQLRNMMHGADSVYQAGHALGHYTKGLAKTPFETPLADPNTAEHVSRAAEQEYAAGKDFSLAMEDGIYLSAYPRDKELMLLQWDKYSMRWSVTDPMLQLLNGVAGRLRERHPESRSKIGFLIYSNMFLPPTQVARLEPSLYAMLAPIDIDPNHAMGDPQSPPKNEYRAILSKWAKLTEGRLVIYDYDQSMLLWRDLPNPSHLAFKEDVKRYRDAGVLGFSTESRMALATTGINLYLRGRLMWNPDEDVDALLEDYYARFYGPARAPMRDYWRAIFKAWQDTIVTEHEHFLIPAIYTPQLVARLEAPLRQAENALKPLRQPGRHLADEERLYLERFEFVRLGYETLKAYVAMIEAAATNVDYQAAVVAGERGLQARDALTRANPAFTTTGAESGAAFWPGEVAQYRDVRELIGGGKGRLLATLPLEWSFRRDKERKGVELQFSNGPVDLTYWREHGGDYDLDLRKDYPSSQWEVVKTDMYIQAQGIRDPDRQSYTGDYWYRTEAALTAEQIGAHPHILFPGLVNSCELYLNGKEAARRTQLEPWWFNDQRFEWDVPLDGKVREGVNVIALRCHSLHHLGGMFRRPFLYAPIEAQASGWSASTSSN